MHTLKGEDVTRPSHLKGDVDFDEADFSRPARGEGKGAGILPTLLLAVVITLVVRTFVIDSFAIPSGSMEQTIQVGNRVIGEKISYRMRDPEPGEIVTFTYGQDGREDILIKRVVAVGGQTVDLIDGVVYVDGQALDEPYTRGLPSYPLQTDDESIVYPYTVPQGYIWVMGDNRVNSRDSRAIGPIPVADVTSHAVLIFWPPEDFSTI